MPEVSALFHCLNRSLYDCGSMYGDYFMSEKLVLIDGHSILNRAFYGVPDLTNSSGMHTNAIYGFLNILFKILDEDFGDEEYGVGIRKGDNKMVEAFNNAYKKMAEDGTLKEISEKWFGEDITLK